MLLQGTPMLRLQSIELDIRPVPLLGNFLDNLIHPKRDPETAHDPGRPFTPPPSLPSKEEEDDDDNGPSLPMDPVLA